jgi:hypothetical protein
MQSMAVSGDGLQGDNGEPTDLHEQPRLVETRQRSTEYQMLDKSHTSRHEWSTSSLTTAMTRGGHW